MTAKIDTGFDGAGRTVELDLEERRLAMAQAGLSPEQVWDDVVALAAALPEEMWAPFLGLARAARGVEPCPDDATLAALYGTSSPRRARRMLDLIAEKGLIVVRVDIAGKRSVRLPHLGWATKPAPPEAIREGVRRSAGARRD